MVARDERVIVHLGAEVARVGIGDHLACVLGCAQESSDECVETELFGTGQLDRAVHGRPECDVGQAAATSSDTTGCIRAGDKRTVCPSVADWAMPPMKSKNCVERRMV